MKAVFLTRFGGSDVLQIGDIARNEKIGEHEVRIRAAYTSVNPVDWKIREGYLQTMIPHEFPLIPGWDVSGTIAEVGSAVTHLKKGDAVFAYGRKDVVQYGTYAEEVVLPSASVAKKPTSISLADAAAVPLTGLTAWQAVTELLKVGPGDTILVTAGSGGTGSFAVQFAKLFGATVIATGSQKNFDYIKGLGADHVIDYSDDVVAAVKKIVPSGVTKVFDAIGGTGLSEAYRCLARGARLVSIVDTPDAAILAAAGATGEFHFVYPSGQQLATLAGLIDAHKISLPAISVGSIKDAVKHQDLNREGHTRGKVVLTIDF
jgi:NADPH2:quinone reductase